MKTTSMTGGFIRIYSSIMTEKISSFLIDENYGIVNTVEKKLDSDKIELIVLITN